MPDTALAARPDSSLAQRLALGLNLPTWEDRHGRAVPWSDIRSLARAAEAAGVDTLWAPDHLQVRQDVAFWECWTVLTAVAQVTSRVTLGPHVLCTAYGNPALVAKMAATLDEICGGRLVVGLGYGLPEFDASWRIYGYPIDHVVGRFAEAVEIIARLLREGRADFRGAYYQVDGCELRPRGPRAAGPPIWVAARGQRMLQLTARWADALNYQAPGTAARDLPAIFAGLDDACHAVGRDPATLLRTAYTLISFAGPERAAAGPRAHALRGTAEEIALGLD
jgi:alkanesulfonate monooxygenase SsuD/methylene tetrahydromethanopterin reductase-like flavin-dependent oxidoreductase (luciferase family)